MFLITFCCYLRIYYLFLFVFRVFFFIVLFCFFCFNEHLGQLMSCIIGSRTRAAWHRYIIQTVLRRWRRNIAFLLLIFQQRTNNSVSPQLIRLCFVVGVLLFRCIYLFAMRESIFLFFVFFLLLFNLMIRKSSC